MGAHEGRPYEGLGLRKAPGGFQNPPLRGNVFMGCNGGRAVREPPLRGMAGVGEGVMGSRLRGNGGWGRSSTRDAPYRGMCSWSVMGEGRFANRPYGGWVGWRARFFEGIGMTDGGIPQGTPLRGMYSWVAIGEGRFANRPYGGWRALARG